MAVEKQSYSVWSCDESPLALTLGRSTVKVSVRPTKLGGGTGTNKHAFHPPGLDKLVSLGLRYYHPSIYCLSGVRSQGAAA